MTVSVLLKAAYAKEERQPGWSWKQRKGTTFPRIYPAACASEIGRNGGQEICKVCDQYLPDLSHFCDKIQAVDQVAETDSVGRPIIKNVLPRRSSLV